MATFTKFNSFITAVAAGTHAGFLNADTDVVKVYLSNATPSASLDALKADLAEISMTNLDVAAGGADISNASTQTTSLITVTGTDVTFTASGAVATFRYAVLYNDTAASDPLIGYYDYGSAITMADLETFVVDFGASVLTLG